jgi:aminoglycoside phosphotransferase (APT) family kinase protein
MAHILKRHPADRHFRAETAGLRWAAALGPGRAPRLLAADRSRRAVIMTLLPGRTLLTADLSTADQREAYRQAGLILALLHTAVPATADTREVGRLLRKADQLLEQARDQLTAGEHAQVREQARQLRELAPQLPAVSTHGDFQPRNLLWDPVARHLAVIDFEKAAPAAAVRDLMRRESGPLRGREDLREAFYHGFGRALSRAEHAALAARAVLAGLADLAWGTANGDAAMADRGRRMLTAPEPRW